MTPDHIFELVTFIIVLILFVIIMCIRSSREYILDLTVEQGFGLLSTFFGCMMFVPQIWEYVYTGDISTLSKLFLFFRTCAIICNGVYLRSFFNLELEEVLPMYISYGFAIFTTCCLWGLIVYHHHFRPCITGIQLPSYTRVNPHDVRNRSTLSGTIGH